MLERFVRTFRNLATITLLAFPVTLLAQPLEVGLKMDVDKRQVELGDHLTLTLEFRQLGSGNSSVMGQPQISTPENFAIRGQRSSTQVTIINQQTAAISTTRLELEATKVGSETLGPALLIYQDEKGKKREVKSNVISVTVVEKTGFSLFGHKKSAAAASPNNPPLATPSPAVNDEQLRGLKPLLPESTMFLILIWIAIALLIAGFIWRQMKKAPKSVTATPVGKATQLREAWKKLGKEELDAKEFCLGLSNLVRECLQYRYNFSAVHFTTEEILQYMASVTASDDEKNTVEKLLKTCDRVLHADGNLTGRDNLRSMCSTLLPKAPKG